MLLSFNLLQSLVMNKPAAENAPSALTDVGGTDFRVSLCLEISLVLSFVDSKTASSFQKCWFRSVLLHFSASLHLSMMF